MSVFFFFFFFHVQEQRAFKTRPSSLSEHLTLLHPDFQTIKKIQFTPPPSGLLHAMHDPAGGGGHATRCACGEDITRSR